LACLSVGNLDGRSIGLHSHCPPKLVLSYGLSPEYSVIGRVTRRIWGVAMTHRRSAGHAGQLKLTVIEDGNVFAVQGWADKCCSLGTAARRSTRSAGGRTCLTPHTSAAAATK
jgi:hypothetical protein